MQTAVKYLSICVSDGKSPDIAMHLPSKLVTTHLEVLRLYDMSLAWSVVFNLVHLDVTFSHEYSLDVGCGFSLGDLLSALSRCPGSK
jgi:hypothetical protein